MTQQIIDTGLVANDGTGESLRNSFTAVNNNFANVWAAGPVDTQVVIKTNVVSTNVTNLELRLAGNGIGTITVESTLIPSIDRVYDLGSPTRQFDSIYSQYYFGNGSFLTGIGNGGSSSNSFSTIAANGTNILATSATDTLTLTAGNNIVIVGNSVSDSVTIALATNPVLTGNITVSNMSVVSNIIGANATIGNLSISGNITSSLTVSGNISAEYYTGNGRQLTGILTSLSGNLAGNIDTLGYNLSSSNGAVLINDTLSVTGTVITNGGMVSGGSIATTANITGNYFIGDGSQLTNLPAGNYSNANVAAYLPTYTGNISAANVSATGNVTGAYVLGNGSQLTGIVTVLSGNLAGNIDTGPYNLSSSNGAVLVNDALSVTGTVITNGGMVSGGSIATTANITGNYFIGDGSALTSLTGGNVGGTVANATYALTANAATYSTHATYATTANAVAGANVSGTVANATYAMLASGATTAGTVTTAAQPNITSVGTLTGLNVNGNITGNYFIGDGSQLTNLPAGNYSNANVAAYLPTYTGNVAAGNISVTGNITGAYVLGNGRQLTGIVTVLSGNLAGNIDTLGYNLFSSISPVLINDALSVTGNITTGGIVSGGPIVTTANISGNYILGDGSQLTNLPAGNYSNANVAAYLPTYTGNISANNFIGNGAALTTITGANIVGVVANATYATQATQANTANTANSVAGANVLGAVANATYATSAGSATTANSATVAQAVTSNAQPNITSVGTLTSVSSSGNITGVYILGNGSQLTGVVKSLAGNLAGNINTLEYSINSSNGEVRFGNAISVIGNATITDDLIVGDQIVNTGNITTAANVHAQYFIGNVVGNIVGNLIVPGANTQVVFNTNGTADATSGFTFNKVSNTVTVGGNISAVGNVSGNYILGNGASLTGVITSVANINNGTSNVTVVSSGGNVTIGVGGTGNIAVFATTGEYVTGVISASGTVTGGNVITAGAISAASVSASGIIYASSVIGGVLEGTSVSVSGIVTGASVVGGIMVGTSVSVSGNITGGNVNSVGFITTSGNIIGGNILTNNYYYANGVLVDFDQPGGSNTQIQFNDANDFGASANLIFNKVTNTLTVTGNIVGNNIKISTVNSTTNGNITLSPNGTGIFKINSTSGFVVPVGNTVQRPATVDQGTLRLNTTIDQLELYNGVDWIVVGSGSGNISIVDQQITPDGSSLVYTLTQTSTAASIIVSLNGVIQIPLDGYTIAGTDITFIEAPLVTDIIDIRFLTAVTAPSVLYNTTANSSVEVTDTPSITFNVNNTVKATVTAAGIMDISTGHSLKLPTYTVLQATALGNLAAGELIYVSNGDTGNACLAVYSGGGWRRVSLGANISS